MPNDPANGTDPIAFSARAPVPIGRQAEPRVLSAVCTIVAASDHSVEMRPARDDRGEDGCLLVDGMLHTVQITGVPQAPPFWREVAKGSATTTATLEQVSQWLETAISAKLAITPPADRQHTILALDAHGWADAVIQPPVIQALTSCGLNPAQRHNFAGIAIVGTQKSNSTWLPGALH